MRRRPIGQIKQELVDTTAVPSATGQRYRQNNGGHGCDLCAMVKFNLGFADQRTPRMIGFRLYAGSVLDVPPGAD
jgi:hypothetical protein